MTMTFLFMPATGSEASKNKPGLDLEEGLDLEPIAFEDMVKALVVMGVDADEARRGLCEKISELCSYRQLND